MKTIDTVTNKKIHRVYIFVLISLIFFSFFLINQGKSIPFGDDDDGEFSSADDSYELIITSPNDGDTFDINEVTLEWELLPPSCLISIIYKVQVDNQAFIDVGTDTSYHFTGLEDGQRTLRVFGFTDQKIYSDSVNITINTDDKGESSRDDDDDDDYEDPKIEITYPNDSDIFNVNEVTLQWELTNSESCEVDYYEVKILESESWINVGTDTSYQFTNLEDGEVTLQVRAIDENGNIGSTDSVTITIDTEDYEELPPVGNGENTNPPSIDGDDDDDDDNIYNNNDNKRKKSNDNNDEKENQNEDKNNKEKTDENGPIALFTYEEEQNTQTKSNFKLPSIIGSITNLKNPEISWIIVIGIILLSIALLLIYLIKSKNIYLINKI